MNVDNLRDKCRTCRYLSLNEGNTTSGYCWQTDMLVLFTSYMDFPNPYDPGCKDIHGEKSVWEPTALLKSYFDADEFKPYGGKAVKR